MRWFHALFIGLGIVFAGALIAASNLWWNRYKYFSDPSAPIERITRVDRATGEVYYFDRRLGWLNVRVP